MQLGAPATRLAICLKHRVVVPSRLIRATRDSALPRPAGRRALSCTAAAAAAAAPTATHFWPVLVQAFHADPVGILLGLSSCLAAVALSILLVAAVPALLALRRSAHAMEALLHTVREEVPGTAAVVRLSGLEIADAVEEVSALGSDLTSGIRASARALTDAEAGMRQGIDAAGQVLHDTIKTKAPAARDAVQAALKERAQLQHTEPTLAEMANATKMTAQRLRLLLGTATAANAAAATVGRLRGGGQSRTRRRQHQKIDPGTAGA